MNDFPNQLSSMRGEKSGLRDIEIYTHIIIIIIIFVLKSFKLKIKTFTLVSLFDASINIFHQKFISCQKCPMIHA